MRPLLLASIVWGCVGGPVLAAAADALPFQHKVEVYRDEKGDILVFTLRLEQPFLAEEFEKSNYLRLKPLDELAYLIYPKETTFQQKHAEFYGRLRGAGKAKVQLSYEIVAEKPDGTRQVQVRQAAIEVPIPTEPTGPKGLYAEWAVQQNRHFADLLRYYPEESFFQYCLLQSPARYGIAPPPIPKIMPDRGQLETDLYQVFTGSLAIQESLQRQALSAGARTGDLNILHVSTLTPPDLRSLGYEKLLEEKRIREKVEPKPHELTRLVPADQYLLQFNSMKSLGELSDLTSQWGTNLLRLFRVQAKDQRLEAKLEDQLCLRRGPLTKLFADLVIAEMAITGTDPFVQEGTDVTMIFRLKQPEVFQKAAAGWLEEVRKDHPDAVAAEFNYRGHKVNAHYTGDRMVSSFVVRHDDLIVYSNSHRAIRRIIDVATGAAPSLYDALDYRYVTTFLPPSPAAESGYFFAPEAMIRRLVSPAAKISEKRRLQCFNNLVMLNNASLFYRLEYGRSPKTLSDLVEGRFVDPAKVVCPHGGAYSFDAARDTCTCSLHNRLKYLTPNIELTVLNVSQEEAAEYNRYKQRYQAFWQKMFDPIAVRLTIGPRVRLETCVLPLANGSYYGDLRQMVDKNPRPLGTGRIAPSAMVSWVAVPGRQAIAEHLRGIPGVAETLKANPTLADLKWIGDRASFHLCDGQSILEIDPMQLRDLDLPMMGKVPVAQQAMVGALVTALKMPLYVSVDVENCDSAAQFLKQLSQQVILQQSQLMGVTIASDGYRLPDYKQHPLYVFSVQAYALKLRLHVALVDDQLVIATKPEMLREVIDAAGAKEAGQPVQAHMLLRLNPRALSRAYDDVQLYWAERSRAACHRNISSIYNLAKLYGTPIAEMPRLSEAKYGVTYFCPDHGLYAFDAEQNQVLCSVHGNRQDSRQHPLADKRPSFAQFIESLDEVVAALRFQDDALIATVDIVRTTGAKK